MEQRKMVSITSADMDVQIILEVPKDILEYRLLEKQDLINKILEARQELAILKKNPINEAKVQKTAKEKNIYALAQELFILRTTLKEVLRTTLKEILSEENKNRDSDGNKIEEAKEIKEVNKIEEAKEIKEVNKIEEAKEEKNVQTTKINKNTTREPTEAGKKRPYDRTR